MYLVLDHWVHYTVQMVWWIPYLIPLDVLVMYTTTSGVCCDASHVGSLDTLHSTDGLVDTIPGTHLHLLLEVLYAYGMYLVLDHWIHYTLQMVWWIPYQIATPLEHTTL